MRHSTPREKALKILCLVEHGTHADELIDKARASFDTRDSAFLLELVYGTLRNRALLDWRLNQLSREPVSKTDSWTRNIVRLGAYQMFCLDRIPISAAVNTSTDLASMFGKKKGYVNGLLRNLDRRRSQLLTPSFDDGTLRLSTVYSHPEWLMRRWIARFGADTIEQALQSNNQPAPLVIRVNTLRIDRAGLLNRLFDEGVAAEETFYSDVGIVIHSSPPLRTLASFKEGLFFVQDEAAQLIVPMLSAEPGDMVLDACAAPGGKSTHLAERMNDMGSITALDSSSTRLQKITENCRRLGISSIHTRQADASSFSEGLYDRILIDAPCSGLGVLRRHPDGRWNKSESTILDHSTRQRAIVQNCIGMLKSDGVLVYSTCTTEPEENEEIVRVILSSEQHGMRLEDPRPYLPEAAHSLVDDAFFLRTFPSAPLMDGFFGARFRKRKGVS